MKDIFFSFPHDTSKVSKKIPMITCGLLKWQLSMTYSIVNSLNLTFEAEITILKDKIQRPNHDTHGLNKKFDFSNI